MYPVIDRMLSTSSWSRKQEHKCKENAKNEEDYIPAWNHGLTWRRAACAHTERRESGQRGGERKRGRDDEYRKERKEIRGWCDKCGRWHPRDLDLACRLEIRDWPHQTRMGEHLIIWLAVEGWRLPLSAVPDRNPCRPPSWQRHNGILDHVIIRVISSWSKEVEVQVEVASVDVDGDVVSVECGLTE
jgi:hypothetical protein